MDYLNYGKFYRNKISKIEINNPINLELFNLYFTTNINNFNKIRIEFTLSLINDNILVNEHIILTNNQIYRNLENEIDIEFSYITDDNNHNLYLITNKKCTITNLEICENVFDEEKINMDSIQPWLFFPKIQNWDFREEETWKDIENNNWGWNDSYRIKHNRGD